MNGIKIAFMVFCVVSIASILHGCSTKEDKPEEKAQGIELEEVSQTAKRKSKTQSSELTREIENDIIISANSQNKNQSVAEKPDGLLGYEVMTKKAGESSYAYIRISKEDLQKASEEDFRKFAEENIKGRPYNWFTVFCDDGTGIQFNGCNYTTAVYGIVDADGCIDEPQGYIWMKEGKYTYEE